MPVLQTNLLGATARAGLVLASVVQMSSPYLHAEAQSISPTANPVVRPRVLMRISQLAGDLAEFHRWLSRSEVLLSTRRSSLRKWCVGTKALTDADRLRPTPYPVGVLAEWHLPWPTPEARLSFTAGPSYDGRHMLWLWEDNVEVVSTSGARTAMVWPSPGCYRGWVANRSAWFEIGAIGWEHQFDEVTVHDLVTVGDRTWRATGRRPAYSAWCPTARCEFVGSEPHITVVAVGFPCRLIQIVGSGQDLAFTESPLPLPVGWGCRQCVFSPDGARLAWILYGPEKDQCGIWVSLPDGRHMQKLWETRRPGRSVISSLQWRPGTTDVTFIWQGKLMALDAACAVTADRRDTLRVSAR